MRSTKPNDSIRNVYVVIAVVGALIQFVVVVTSVVLSYSALDKRLTVIESKVDETKATDAQYLTRNEASALIREKEVQLAEIRRMVEDLRLRTAQIEALQPRR